MWNESKLLKIISTSSLILFLCVSSIQAQTSNVNNICDTGGYAIGFFNGVWNTKIQAQGGRDVLASLIGGNTETYKGEPLSTELFYNTSGISDGRLWSTHWEDIAEVFSERSTELDGILANRWEFFWEAMNGNQSLWDILKQRFIGAGSILVALERAFLGKSLSVLTGLVSSPPTASDYALHNTRINALATERKKLLFVAHSQGNLFVNVAYNTAKNLVTDSSVKVVHIAPASININGAYTLADIDAVINGLRIAPGVVPDNNVFLPINISADWSGHKLVETYLDSNRAARKQIHDDMVSALDMLVTPTTTYGNAGFFTVTLTWDGSGDVDLHTIEPDNTHVFYANKTGHSGALDTDNTVSKGPEHYSSTCDAAQLQVGTYQIGINNYARATGRVATVQVASIKTGELLTKTLGVGEEQGSNGDSSPIPVFNVFVSKDINGEFSVTAQ